MGKKRIEKIERIENNNQRKVCLCKRKKGLLKKAIELSVLCEVDVCLFILDRGSNRATHFGSNQNLDLKSIFNEQFQREFFSNHDYGKVGGNTDEIDSRYVAAVQSALSQDQKDIFSDEEIEANF